MPCTYVLYSRIRDMFYVGSTREGDCKIRLKAHNAGKTKSTKAGGPWVIVLEEQFSIYTEARKREIALKSGQGRKWIGERWQSGRMRRS